VDREAELGREGDVAYSRLVHVGRNDGDVFAGILDVGLHGSSEVYGTNLGGTKPICRDVDDGTSERYFARVIPAVFTGSSAVVAFFAAVFTGGQTQKGHEPVFAHGALLAFGGEVRAHIPENRDVLHLQYSKKSKKSKPSFAKMGYGGQGLWIKACVKTLRMLRKMSESDAEKEP